MPLLCFQKVTFVNHPSMSQQTPPLSALVAFLKQKQKLEVKASYHHDMRNLLMSLNSTCIDSIKQEFLINENCLNLEKFLWLLRKAIEPDTDNLTIYYELTRLFEDIDIDGSSTIEWKEFLEYLSSSAWISQANQKYQQPMPHDKKMLVHAFREDIQYRKHPIKKIIEIQRNELIGVINSDCKVEFISFNREEKKKDQTKNGQFELQHVDNNKILAFDYADAERLYAVLMSNRNLCFIEDGEMQKVLGVIRSTGTEIDVKYLPLHRLWTLENANSTLTFFPSPKGSAVEQKLVFQPHKQPITGVQEITSPQALCTSSLDGTIRLWQISTGRLIIQLSAKHQLPLLSQHEKGVKGIATYNKNSSSYICSWMFTSEIYLWLPSLSLSKPFSAQLTGHMGLVIDCVFTSQGELISLDDKRGLRMWNLDKGECIQHLIVQQESIRLLSLKSKPYLVVYSKLMDFYRLRTNTKADIQSEIILAKKGERNVLTRGELPNARIISTFFSEYYSALVIVTSQELKILDVNSCSLLASLLPAREDEEFIGMTPKGNRRVYLGTSKGLVYEYKIQNGRNIKTIEVSPLEENELKFVYYHQETKILMTVIEGSTSSFIVTYNEMMESDEVVKEIEFDQKNLDFFEFSTLYERFFILSQGEMTVWNYDKLVIVNKLSIGYLKDSRVINLILQEKSRTLFLVTKNEIIMLKFDEFGTIQSNGTSFSCFCHKNELTGGSLMACQVPGSHFSMMGQEKSKHTVYFGSDNGTELRDEPTVSKFILNLTNAHNQSHFFDFTQSLTETIYFKHNLKGKVQRIKEKRKTYLNQLEELSIQGLLDLHSTFFTEKPLLVPNNLQVGNILGYFYFFSEDKNLTFFDFDQVLKGEWNLSLSRPKKWRLFYNDIDKIMSRLSKTQLALKRIVPFRPDKLKTQLLLEKYITQEELSQLVNLVNKSAKSIQVVEQQSRKTLHSKKSEKSAKDQMGSRNTFHQFKASKKQQALNPFAKKLETQFIRKHHKDNASFYSKISQSIKMKPSGASTPALLQISSIPQIHVNPFVQQMEYLFVSKTGAKVETRLDESLVKEKKRESLKQSLGERPLSSLPKSSSLGSKLRIKSNLDDLARNFVHNKIECENFLKRSTNIVHAAKTAIAKRVKLKL